MTDWLRIAARRDIVTRSVKVALIVGSILVAINQGNRLLAGEWSLEIALKMVLTFLVPYCVSTYASVSAVRAQTSPQDTARSTD